MSNWHIRYKAFKRELNFTNKDIAKITGHTEDSIKNATQPNNDFPRWLKLAVVVHEGRWVKFSDRLPPTNCKIIVCLDYSDYGGRRSWQRAWFRHTPTPIDYGGPNSRIGRGKLTGHYFTIPAIVPFEIGTHWMIEPVFPKIEEDGDS